MDGIGERIKSARLREGFTQEELAKAINTTKAAISRYESGKRNPSNEVVKKIAEVLKISLVELYFGMNSDEFTQNAMNEYEAYEKELEDYYLPGCTKDLVAAFRKLNTEGQRKAIERVEELTEITKYLADDIE